ncbi:MAG: cobalt transporter [Desulfurococcales archaeon]|nr:cobalt transporter [Desulfurococcales archaeon]MCE4605498.1 cobalt transporter [Desulfurococcales archaeon]
MKRWVSRRHRRGPVVRKILKAVEAVRIVYRVALASVVMSIAGILLYTLYYPSDIILFEAFVWLIEAVSFAGIAVAFKIASSRTLLYKSRYEVLRVEALASSAIGVVGIIVVAMIIMKSISGGKGATPIILSLYPLGSAVASYILESMLHKKLHRLEVKLVSIHVISSKLRYDVIVEAAGGVAIILSNLLHNPLVETLLIVSIGAYVLYGLAGITYANTLYLIGPGPSGRREEIKTRITRELKTRGYKPRNIRVEVYGTFSEAEVWIEQDAEKTLARAHREALTIAKALVHNVPELLRVVVINVPARRKTYRRVRRGEEQGVEATGGRRHTSP